MDPTLAFLGPIGWQELLVLAVFGLLIFGKRLPDVGKSLGKGIVEFKKGLQGIEEDLDSAGDDTAARSSEPTAEGPVEEEKPDDTATSAPTRNSPPVA